LHLENSEKKQRAGLERLSQDTTLSLRLSQEPTSATWHPGSTLTVLEVDSGLARAGLERQQRRTLKSEKAIKKELSGHAKENQPYKPSVSFKDVQQPAKEAN
jgi:hypothetical protein